MSVFSRLRVLYLWGASPADPKTTTPDELLAGLAGLSRLETLLKKWCRPVNGLPLATDIEWPPQSGLYLRPGPIAEARLLGRWPSQATNNVWSDGAWQSSELLLLPEPTNVPCEIGCDVARFGDDFTEIHVRRGPVD